MSPMDRAGMAVEAAMASEDNHPLDIARAVLLAVREPGDKALERGSAEGGYDSYQQVQNTPEIWTVMIDAILEGE